jgi:alkylation response protein AidB-like acyl-CoA dehydrogenase
VDFAFGPEDEAFRREARTWLEEHLADPPGRRAWERELGRGGWIGLGWDEDGYGNRRAGLTRQVVWAEEYARSKAPTRSGHIGENLLAPTLVAHGTPEQKRRFLPPIAQGRELWCQGYSEPEAGSDLAGIRTTAVRVPDVTAVTADVTADVRAEVTVVAGAAAAGVKGGGEPTAAVPANGAGAADLWPSAVRGEGAAPSGAYRVTGQKIWTSLAHEADWCFVLARTEPGSTRHHGLSFLLVPMDQPGRVEVRPIRQLTGTSEFNEVFFDGALARAEHVVGGAGNGWRVAMSLLGFERGVSTLAQQIGFAEELGGVLRTAVATGAATDPVVRDRLVRLWAELRTMRWNALRTLGSSGSSSGSGGGAGVPSVAKLLWGGWHQRLGELAVQVGGAGAAVGPVDWSAELPYELDAAQRLFLFSRADTIYGGSDEIQRTIIAERALGLPREPRG